MQNQLWLTIKPCVTLTVFLMALCGLAYPLAMNGLAALLFPSQAHGDLIVVNGQAVGSKHVGQNFTADYFMKGRPSAVNYNTYIETAEGKLVLNNGTDTEFTGPASGSQNLAPSNPALIERIEADTQAFLAKNPTITKDQIPADLITASGSGLDPHISVEAALIQLPALAKASHLSQHQLRTIVNNNTQKKFLGIFGENVVNVLEVNIDIYQAMQAMKAEANAQ